MPSTGMSEIIKQLRLSNRLRSRPQRDVRAEPKMDVLHKPQKFCVEDTEMAFSPTNRYLMHFCATLDDPLGVPKPAVKTALPSDVERTGELNFEECNEILLAKKVITRSTFASKSHGTFRIGGQPFCYRCRTVSGPYIIYSIQMAALHYLHIKNVFEVSIRQSWQRNWPSKAVCSAG